MAEKQQTTRQRPARGVSPERKRELVDAQKLRAESLKHDKENGNVSRSKDNPDVGRPAKPKEPAKKKGDKEDAS